MGDRTDEVTGACTADDEAFTPTNNACAWPPPGCASRSSTGVALPMAVAQGGIRPPREEV